MPSSFASEFAAGAFRDLVAEFGEVTTYRPHGGTPREIDAIIVTDPLQLQALSGEAPSARALIRTLNSATRGILASEINYDHDTVDVILPNDTTATAVALKQLVSDNGGVTSVACY